MTDKVKQDEETSASFEAIGSQVDEYFKPKLQEDYFSHIGFLLDQLIFNFLQLSDDIEKIKDGKEIKREEKIKLPMHFN
jgi:hypothetical protein